MTPQWLPIESAPKDGTRVIVYCDWCFKVCIGWYKQNRKGWMIAWGKGLGASYDEPVSFPMGGPSHWMPLPDPPQEDS